MADFLLLEIGDKITLEDGTGSILLEDFVAPTGFTARRTRMWYRIYTNGIGFLIWLMT